MRCTCQVMNTEQEAKCENATSPSTIKIKHLINTMIPWTFIDSSFTQINSRSESNRSTAIGEREINKTKTIKCTWKIQSCNTEPLKKHMKKQQKIRLVKRLLVKQKCSSTGNPPCNSVLDHHQPSSSTSSSFGPSSSTSLKIDSTFHFQTEESVEVTSFTQSN